MVWWAFVCFRFALFLKICYIILKHRLISVEFTLGWFSLDIHLGIVRISHAIYKMKE